MILMQTKAIFIDAYRELNAKKLFWLTMVLNLLAVAIFASIGINERGTTLLHWTFDSQIMNTNFFEKEFYYKNQFTGLGVRFWLSWVSAILALVSTAGLIPDMVSSGTIEPMLSKPIGRARLFITKYATGLLFVGLQVLVFTLGCFIVMGVRAGAWEPRMFLAVPIVIVFFSYIFSFCAFVGLITRSTITALLLTCIFWSSLFVIQMGEGTVNMFNVSAQITMEDRLEEVQEYEDEARLRIETLRETNEPIPGEDGAPLPREAADSLEAVYPYLATARKELASSEKGSATWSSWNNRIIFLKTILPKTGDTLSLLKRNLVSEDAMTKMVNAQLDNQQEYNEEDMPAFADPRVARRIHETQVTHSTFWIIGTSLIFEAVLLGLCLVIFIRRDF